MYKRLIKLYYSLKTSIGCLLSKVRYKIYLTQELLKRSCLHVEMLFLEVIPPRMGRFEGYRNSFFKSISFKKLLSFFEIFNVPFEHLSKVTLIKIGMFYSLFYIFLFQLVLYNTAGLLFVLWFLVFGQIKKIKYSQKLYIRLMQSNPNKYSIKLLLLLFVTPCRIIIFINILITTDITIFDLLPIVKKTGIFDTFFCFDLERHLYDTFKIKKNINIKSLNHLIILFLFLNVSLLLVRLFIYYFKATPTKYPKKGKYKQRMNKRRQKNRKTPNKQGVEYTNCMMRRCRNFKGGRKILKKPVASYKLFVVRVEELNNKKEGKKHGAIYYKFESAENFESWLSKYPERGLLNATRVDEGDAVFIAEKNLNGEIIRQYFRRYPGIK